MKYKGSPVVLETRELTLERATGPITLTVSAVSIGVRRDYDAVYPKPQPPTTVTESKSGRKTDTNWEDPNWRKAIEEREFLQNIYLVYRVVSGDARLQFDNVPTNVESLRALAKEFSESGFSEGDLGVILKEALKASNISQDEITELKKSF